MSKIHNKNAFVPLYFVYETAVTVTTSLLSFFSISSTLHTETNTYISFRKGDTFLCILECQFDELCCMNEFGIFAPINSLDFSFSKRIFISIHFLKFVGFYFFTLHSNFHLLLHSVWKMTQKSRVLGALSKLVIFVFIGWEENWEDERLMLMPPNEKISTPL